MTNNLSIDTQTMEVAQKLSHQERGVFYRLVRAYKRLRFPSIAQELEGYGLSIDEKDYGADQNVEKGSETY